MRKRKLGFLMDGREGHHIEIMYTGLDTSEDRVRSELVRRHPAYILELNATEGIKNRKRLERAIISVYRRWGVMGYNEKSSPRYYDAKRDKDAANIKKGDWVFVVPPNLKKNDVEAHFKLFLDTEYPIKDRSERFNRGSFDDQLKIYDLSKKGTSLPRIAKEMNLTPDAVRKALKKIKAEIISMRPVNGKLAPPLKSRKIRSLP
jgi:hypothetical protein